MNPHGFCRKWERPPWDIRAIWCEDVLDEESGDAKGFWFWFVSMTQRDQWFAHAVSEDDSDDTLERILLEIEPVVFETMIPLGGHPWEIILPYPVQHARSQRDLLHAVRESGSLDDLVGSTEQEIAELRRSGETEIH